MQWMIQRRYKQWIASVLVVLLAFSLWPAFVAADALTGETVVTLGEDLSEAQQNQLLDEMGVDEEVPIRYVSNEEEHQYLGDYIDASIIGDRAISSTRIVISEEGSGIKVETNNITWVTEEMYANALATAGVKDADVYVTAPFEVSGTAGLTGLTKAFEEAADTEISEEQKQVANEEMVRTAELAENIGAAEAAELMRRLKEQLDNRTLETDEDFRQLVLDVAAELNIELTDEDVDALVHLLKRLKGLNIDWGQVSDQLQNIRDNLNDILDSEDTRNFIRKALDYLISLFDRIKELFAS